LVGSSLEKLQKNYDVDLHWRSFLLRPPGSPPMSPQRRAQLEASRPLFQKRAREQYGVEVNAGPLGIDSRPALVAEKYAEAQGKGEAFHRAVMQAYWQQARAIDDKDVLKEIAASVGLNTENFASLLESPQFNAEVDADIALASEYRLDGVPALIFDNRYLVVGAQPYDVLKQVMEQVQDKAN
jgi:predicted DsbA family dithiol-disulfide isomerase